MKKISGKTRISLCMVCCICFMTGCPNITKMTATTAKITDAPDWTDPVAEGMEVTYFLSREYKVDDNGNWWELTYQPDDQGRVSIKDDKYGATHLRTTYFYNEDGTLAREEVRVIKNGHTKNKDYDTFYKYNEQGLLITTTSSDSDKDAASGHGPYREYDENGNLISLTDSFSFTTYQYENGVLVSSFTEYNYEWHPVSTSEYDKNGNIIHSLYTSKVIAKDGSEEDYKEEAFYKYNDKNDKVSYEFWKNGEIDYKAETEYTYDNEGKLLKEKETCQGCYPDGKEYTVVFETTYTYDKHGLLILKEKTQDGKFIERYEYDYEPILLPVKE